MAEYLSPNVFIEEVPSTTQVVTSVSTSNMGIVGWTPQGPSNKATLVGSFDQFVSTFGSFDRRSFLAYTVAAFFANGGARAYVVRTVPADAVAAKASIQSLTTDQLIETGDGTTAAHTKTSTTSLLKDNSGASSIVPGSLTISWRGKATAQTTVATKKRDGTTNLTTATGVLKYEGTINPSTLPSVNPHLFAVVPDGTCQIQWTSSSASKSITIANPTGGSTIGTGTNAATSTATLDFRTGRFTLLINVAETPDNSASVTATYSPATATVSITDNGSGVFPAGSALTGAGSVTYTTGAYSFTTVSDTGIPHNLGPILATYKINAWNATATSQGVWGNALKLKMTGSANYFTAATQSFSRYNLAITTTDSFGNDSTKETYEDLVVNDATSPFYFADVVNEFSDLVSFTTPTGLEAPGQLNGIAYTQTLVGGDDSDTGRLVQVTLPSSSYVIAKRSLVITYTASDGTSKTIKDDGKGNLTGDIDATYTGGAANTVNYSTGALDFKTVAIAGPLGIKANTLVTAVWYSEPAETLHTEAFADTTKSYTVGTDGTFDSTNFGRNQFTGPALKAGFQGLYALDRIDELMQVCVPDFAGDLTVSGDLLDYAAAHASAATGGDRFIILTVPKGSTSTDAVDWFRNRFGRFSSYAAIYWPWINISDPIMSGRKLTMPPLGHIAGVYARTDITRNVGKAPGGTIDGALNFLTSLEVVPTRADRDTVYPNLINPLISSPQTGMAVWGVRTISQDSSWKYINARRLFMFLEKSIYNATFWIVFENNGPGLWARIKAQLDSYLLTLFNQGYFKGSSTDQAYFVKCDGSNNTEASIANGFVNIDVGVAPNKPAEFVVFRFSQLSSS